MVIQVRRRLINAARNFRENGVIPPGVDNPEWYGFRSVSGTLPKGSSWVEGFGEWMAGRSNVVPEVNLEVTER